MAFSFKKAVRPFLDVVYPPLCAHCNTRLSARLPLLCPTCLEQISLIDVQDRCRSCFSELHKGRCEKCIHRSVVVLRQFASCEAFGPARSLYNALLQGRREYIPAVASLMVYQWLEQKMHLPDFILPLPVGFWQKQRHGLDMNLMLSKEIGKVLNVPVCAALKMKFDRRQFLNRGAFIYRFEHADKNRVSFCDRQLLMIAPIMDDGAFRSAAQELKASFPVRVDALSFIA